jgi:hypothetical protein
MTRTHLLLLVAACILACVCCAGKAARGTKTTITGLAGYTLGTPQSEFDTSSFQQSAYGGGMCWEKQSTFAVGGQNYPVKIQISFKNNVLWSVSVQFDNVQSMTSKQRSQLYDGIISDLKMEYAPSVVGSKGDIRPTPEMGNMTVEDSSGNSLGVVMMPVAISILIQKPY